MATHDVDGVNITWGTEDSRNMYQPVSIMGYMGGGSAVVSLGVVVNGSISNPPHNDLRCRYCTTKAFEGERHCVSCGAPL